MEMLKIVIFYLLVIDAVAVNIISWTAPQWYLRNFRSLSRALPLTRTWTIAYMVLVAWIGYLTFH